MTSRNDLEIRRATVEDGQAIQSMVTAAYSKYIERIGMRPAPMLTCYAMAVQSQDIYVLRTRSDGRVVGSVTIAVDESQRSLSINNLVVDPSAQGRGYGRVLMEYAEGTARSQGLEEIALFTNVKMYENISLYAKLGFTETERRTEGPYERVYFRKRLE